MKATRSFFSQAHQVLKRQSWHYHSSRPLTFPESKVNEKEPESADSVFLRNVKDYMKERGLSDREISVIPDHLIRRTTKPTSFVLIDRKVAKLLAYTICARASGKYILEFDAGIGIMSEVLEPLVENLRLYVHHSQLVKFLQEKFQDELNKKVNVFDRSFSNLLGILYSKVQDPYAFTKLVKGIPFKPWTEDIPITLITPVSHIKYIKSLLATLVLENSLKQFGRPEFFFLLPETIAEPLLFKEHCAARNVSVHFLLNIFFDVELVLKGLPREAFLPWQTFKKNLKIKDKKFYLLHAIPKLERFEPQVDRQFLNMVVTFVRSALRIRKRIIPTFESFVPYCGSRFIIEDHLTVYTEFHEVTPDTLYSLIQKLTNYPEFDKNSLDKSESMELEGDNDDSDSDESSEV